MILKYRVLCSVWSYWSCIVFSDRIQSSVSQLLLHRLYGKTCSRNFLSLCSFSVFCSKSFWRQRRLASWRFFSSFSRKATLKERKYSFTLPLRGRRNKPNLIVSYGTFQNPSSPALPFLLVSAQVFSFPLLVWVPVQAFSFLDNLWPRLKVQRYTRVK